MLILITIISSFKFTSDAMMINEQFILKRTEINSLTVRNAAILELNSSDSVQQFKFNSGNQTIMQLHLPVIVEGLYLNIHT